MTNATRPVGDLIREWRQRRRLSQFDLACDADISTKHLSFLETGRAAPSQDMLLHLADRLAIPLRDRNVMLSAAGFGPSYQERGMTDPDFRPARACIDQVLRLHEPNPALAIDRHWSIRPCMRRTGRIGLGSCVFGHTPYSAAPGRSRSKWKSVRCIND